MSNQVLLSFGEAVKFLEKGKRVARLGWNGKGMYLVHFSPVGHGLEMLTVYDKEEGTTLPLLPFILMKTADNCYVPFLASQTDVLAKDYIIVETETKKSESKQDDCLDCATSFLGICDKHFTQKLKEIDKQTEKQYMENMKNAENPIAFFNSLIALVELNKKNKVNPELVEELLDETFIGKKSINEQEDVSTGSLFDIAYCVLENVVLHELDKDINKPFWDFIREAKKQGYKRVVLTNGKQYEINDDGSVTTLK